MRYMIIVKGDDDTEAGVMPEPGIVAAMAEYHEALHRAGVLVDASGLQATSKGFRIRYKGDARSVVDGPFTETKEVVAGYTIIQVDSHEQAREWALRYPKPSPAHRDCEIEVRRMFDLDDFEPSDGIEQFRRIGVGSEQGG